VRIEVSQMVERAVADVFRWFVRDHVRNHPRWDPDIELSLEGPVELGSVIHRRNVRYGTAVEGTMEVVEYEQDRAFGVVIREGPAEMPGRATFDPRGKDRTLVTLSTEIPETVPADLVRSRMQHSAENIKSLIEAEL
jgi:hypothetical protein